MRGFTGEKRQKDKPSYISPSKQIEEGRDKDHSDKKIVNAVFTKCA